MMRLSRLINYLFIFGVLFKMNVVYSQEFDESNRPFFEYMVSDDQYVLKPWGYDKSENHNRDYPLVVFLHGLGGAGNIKYLNYIGYDNPEDNHVDSVAYNFQKDYPCFTLVPQTNGGWNNASLIDQVEQFKNNYRIDESRIYLIGYSMGGSGSWSFANAYNQHNGHLFAGLIRLAGQSQTQVTDDIAENTAMWLQIGLSDAQLRVDVTREAYDFLKEYHNNPEEKMNAVPIENYTGITYSLMLNGKDFIKRTEYEGIGHGISAFPFENPYLIEWLFEKKLGCDKKVEVTICEGEVYQFGTKLLTSAGVYTEVYQGVGGCDSTVELTLHVELMEKPNIIQNGDTLTCTNDGEYTWYFNNQLIESANENTYIATMSGKYHVQVTSINGCKSVFSNIITVTLTTLFEQYLAKKIKVYPNPTKELIKIEGFKEVNKTNIRLYDRLGRKLYDAMAKSNVIEININEFLPGIYLIVLSEGNDSLTYKIIKK